MGGEAPHKSARITMCPGRKRSVWGRQAAACAILNIDQDVDGGDAMQCKKHGKHTYTHTYAHTLKKKQKKRNGKQCTAVWYCIVVNQRAP